LLPKLQFLSASKTSDFLLARAKVRNDKARKYLTSMRKKQPASFSQKFPKADPLALQLLRRLLAFDPKDRPSAEEVCHRTELLTDPVICI
jgi:serine/threonine protein kinase